MSDTKLSQFEMVLEQHMAKMVETDSVLKDKYENGGKTISGAAKYITGLARERARNGCAVIPDDEVYGWCVHYFDEEELNCEEKADDGAKAVVGGTNEVVAEAKPAETEKLPTTSGKSAKRGGRILPRTRVVEDGEWKPGDGESGLLFDFVTE